MTSQQESILHSNRCIALANKRSFERAIADCDEAIRLDPKSVAAYNNRGYACIEKGEVDRAIADYDEAIRLNQMNVSSYLGRGNALQTTWQCLAD